MRRTPKKGSDRSQTAAVNQKHPAAVKQPTFTNLAKFQFASSSAIPVNGRITSKTNSNHNWKCNSLLGNPTLRSLVNINQAIQPFAAKTHANRRILFNALLKRTEGPISINDKGFLLFIVLTHRSTWRQRRDKLMLGLSHPALPLGLTRLPRLSTPD